MSTEQLDQSQGMQPNGPGARLKQARLEHKLDQDQIAEKLHLSRQQVEAIERDDFSYVSAIAYARGHLRLYAKLVNQPVYEILKAFDSLGLQETAPQPPPQALGVSVIKNAGKSSTRSKFSLWGWSGVAVITLLLLAGVIVFHHHRLAALNTQAKNNTSPSAAQSTGQAETPSNNPDSPVINAPTQTNQAVPLPIPPASQTQLQSQDNAAPPAPSNEPMPKGNDRGVE